MYEKIRYQLFIDTALFGLALTTNLALANLLFQWLTLLNAQIFLWHFSLLIVYFCIINNF